MYELTAQFLGQHNNNTLSQDARLPLFVATRMQRIIVSQAPMRARPSNRPTSIAMLMLSTLCFFDNEVMVNAGCQRIGCLCFIPSPPPTTAPSRLAPGVSPGSARSDVSHSIQVDGIDDLNRVAQRNHHTSGTTDVGPTFTTSYLLLPSP